MGLSLTGRSFTKLLDFSTEEVSGLLTLAAELKAQKYAGTEVQHLKRKNIALIFEKASTRTRCAFEVAAFDQGAIGARQADAATTAGEARSGIVRCADRCTQASSRRGSSHHANPHVAHRLKRRPTHQASCR